MATFIFGMAQKHHNTFCFFVFLFGAPHFKQKASEIRFSVKFPSFSLCFFPFFSHFHCSWNERKILTFEIDLSKKQWICLCVSFPVQYFLDPHAHRSHCQNYGSHRNKSIFPSSFRHEHRTCHAVFRSAKQSVKLVSYRLMNGQLHGINWHPFTCNKQNGKTHTQTEDRRKKITAAN